MNPRVLMAVITGAEFVNKKFNPLSLKLIDGWSESMMDGIEEYVGKQHYHQRKDLGTCAYFSTLCVRRR